MEEVVGRTFGWTSGRGCGFICTTSSLDEINKVNLFGTEARCLHTSKQDNTWLKRFSWQNYKADRDKQELQSDWKWGIVLISRDRRRV